MVIIKSKMCIVICALTGALTSKTGAELKAGEGKEVGRAALW